MGRGSLNATFFTGQLRQRPSLTPFTPIPAPLPHLPCTLACTLPYPPLTPSCPWLAVGLSVGILMVFCVSVTPVVTDSSGHGGGGPGGGVGGGDCDEVTVMNYSLARGDRRHLFSAVHYLPI